MANHKFSVPMEAAIHQRLESALRAGGLLVGSRLEIGGCRFSADYTDGNLSIEIDKKPFFAPSRMVEDRVRGWLREWLREQGV
jgi:hypothetical protein